jgi:DUF4097 and DUF4098 domain-containing protein YvlB
MSQMLKVRIAISTVLFLICAVSLSAGGRFERINELGIKELYVDSLMIDVEIQGEARLTVEGWGENIPDNLRVKYERIGDILRVRVERRFTLFSLGRIDGKLYFNVPDGIDLEVHSTSGSIEIQEMECSRLKVGSSSGTVRLSGIQSKVNAGSSSGTINLDNVKGSVFASSSSGSVKLTRIDGDIEASSSSGEIEIQTTHGSMRAQSSSGNIEGDNIRLTGESSFRSSSGSIDIDFDNPLSDFTFKLSSSSGRLDIGDVKGQKSLSTGNGRFLIVGETSSGSQRYK